MLLVSDHRAKLCNVESPTTTKFCGTRNFTTLSHLLDHPPREAEDAHRILDYNTLGLFFLSPLATCGGHSGLLAKTICRHAAIREMRKPRQPRAAAARTRHFFELER
jgi:hypothetical protein